MALRKKQKRFQERPSILRTHCSNERRRKELFFYFSITPRRIFIFSYNFLLKYIGVLSKALNWWNSDRLSFLKLKKIFFFFLIQYFRNWAKFNTVPILYNCEINHKIVSFQPKARGFDLANEVCDPSRRQGLQRGCQKNTFAQGSNTIFCLLLFN